MTGDGDEVCWDESRWWWRCRGRRRKGEHTGDGGDRGDETKKSNLTATNKDIPMKSTHDVESDVADGEVSGGDEDNDDKEQEGISSGDW